MVINSKDEDLENRLMKPEGIFVESRHVGIWKKKDEVVSAQFIVDDIKYNDGSLSGYLKFRIRKKDIEESDKDFKRIFFETTERIEIISRNTRRDLDDLLHKYAHIFANKYNSNRDDEGFLSSQIFEDLSLNLKNSILFYYERHIKEIYS